MNLKEKRISRNAERNYKRGRLPEERAIVADVSEFLPSTIVNTLLLADSLVPLVELRVLPHREAAQHNRHCEESKVSTVTREVARPIEVNERGADAIRTLKLDDDS